MPVVENFGSFANRPTQIARLAETLGVNSPTSYTGSTERTTGMANFPVRNLNLRASKLVFNAKGSIPIYGLRIIQREFLVTAASFLQSIELARLLSRCNPMVF